MTYPPNNDPYGNQNPPQPPPYGAPQQPYGAPQQPYGAPQPPPYGAAPQQPYGAPPPGQYGGAPYGAPGYGTAPAAAYASWIQRVGAYLIDGLVLLPFYILAAVAGHSTDSATGVTSLNIFFPIFYLLAIALWGYNRWFQAGKTGQSWGKKVLGIRLVSEETGQPLGTAMAFVRDLAHFVDSVICDIGYLFPLWDVKKQTLADKIVKTIVIS